MKQTSFRPLALLASMAVICLFSCLTGTLKEKDEIASPFPREMLNHRLFPVFLSDELLGCSFREEERGLVGPFYWSGRVSSSSAGEDRSVHFSEEQVRGLSAIFPGVSFKTGYAGSVGYTVILKGLKIKQLSHPLLLPEYRDSREIQKQPFIASILTADEVVIQAELKTEKGIKPVNERDLHSIFEGSYAISKRHRGIVAAKNCLIGYALATPTAEDISREAAGERERRVLAVFEVKLVSGDRKFEFIGDTIRARLEEAMQWIPGIDVMTERREEAKYHVRGELKTDGTRATCALVMTNTYTGKPIARITREFDAGKINELDEFQITAIKEMAAALGIRLNDASERNIRSMVRQAESTESVEKYHEALSLIKKDKYREAGALLERIINKSPGYIDAHLLHAKTLRILSKPKDAEKKFVWILVQAFKYNNPKWKSDAYMNLAEIKAGYNDLITPFQYLEKSLIILLRAKDPDSDLVRKAYRSLGIQYTADIETTLFKDYVKQWAWENLSKSLAITMKSYGPQSLEAAGLYQDISSYYGASGDSPRSLEYALKSQQIIEKLAAADSRETAYAYGFLGYALRANGHLRKALESYTKSLEIFRKVHGDSDNEDTANLLLQRAYTRLMLRDHENAMREFMESLAIQKKIKGDKFDYDNEYMVFAELIVDFNIVHRVYRYLREKGDKRLGNAHRKLLENTFVIMSENYYLGVTKSNPDPDTMFNGAETEMPPRFVITAYDKEDKVHVGTMTLEPLEWLFESKGRVLTKKDRESIFYIIYGSDYFNSENISWRPVSGKKLPENLLLLGINDWDRLEKPLHACRVRKGNVNYFGDLDTNRCVCSYATEEGCEESEVFDVLVEKAK